MNDNFDFEKYDILIYNHLHKLGFWKMFNLDRDVFLLDDFMQEGRMALLSAYENFDPERGTKLRTYLYSAVRRHLSYYARTQKLYRRFSEVPFEDGQITLETDIEDELIAEELLEMMKETQHYELLRDYFFLDKTQSEIAENYSFTQQWVSQIISKFKKQVKEFWD